VSKNLGEERREVYNQVTFSHVINLNVWQYSRHKYREMLPSYVRYRCTT